MFSTRLRRFGQALARLSSDRAVIDRWVDLLSDEWNSIQPFLRPQGPASIISRRSASGRVVHYRVVVHGKTDLVGIDDETGERIDLAFETTQLLGVHWAKVVRALRDGLGLGGPQRALPDILSAWELGAYPLTATRSAMVVLLSAPRDRMTIAIDRLLATGLQEAVIIVPHAAAVNAEAHARLAARHVVVAGMADCLAIDARGCWVGVAGPESVVGDLRARLGLGAVERPPFQIVRDGARWDLVFAGDSFSIADTVGVGMRAVAMLCEHVDHVVPAIDLQAAINHVDRHLFTGNQGPKNDRMTRSQVDARIRELGERMQRHDDTHPEYQRWELEIDRLLTYRQEADGFGGEDHEVTTPAKAGRAIGGAIDRAIAAIEAEGSAAAQAMAAHLRDAIKGRTGQKPCYRPAAPAPNWVIGM